MYSLKVGVPSKKAYPLKVRVLYYASYKYTRFLKNNILNEHFHTLYNIDDNVIDLTSPPQSVNVQPPFQDITLDDVDLQTFEPLLDDTNVG